MHYEVTGKELAIKVKLGKSGMAAPDSPSYAHVTCLH